MNACSIGEPDTGVDERKGRTLINEIRREIFTLEIKRSRARVLWPWTLIGRRKPTGQEDGTVVDKMYGRARSWVRWETRLRAKANGAEGEIRLSWLQ